MITITFEPALVMGEIPDMCESCGGPASNLKPILRSIDVPSGVAWPAVGYICERDRCNQIHLYR